MWQVKIAGRGSVPAGATTAALNITVVAPAAAGHATVYPCGDDVPPASSLNYVPGQVRPNEVVTRLSPDGFVCIYSHATADYLIDAVGYIGPTPTYTSIEPVRYADSRAEPTFDDGYRAVGPIAGGTSWKVKIAGRGDVPADASLAVLNVTAVTPAAAGHLTVYPCLPSVPNASHVNYLPGDVRPNEVIAKLDDDGFVCVYTHATAHLLIDVTGHD